MRCQWAGTRQVTHRKSQFATKSTCKIMARADFCEILPAEAGFQEGCQDEDAERRPLAQQVRPVQYQSQYV